MQAWWRGRKAAIVSASAIAAVLIVTHVPAALAFPYAAQFGATRVHAEVPIDPRLGTELARADRLLAASPIDAPVVRELYLTQGGWRWTVLALTSRDTFALRRPFSDAIIVNRSDIAQDHVSNGAAVGGQRTLSGVIAHETTHLCSRIISAKSRWRWHRPGSRRVMPIMSRRKAASPMPMPRGCEPPEPHIRGWSIMTDGGGSQPSLRETAARSTRCSAETTAA